jgi:hypothetical protein
MQRILGVFTALAFFFLFSFLLTAAEGDSGQISGPCFFSLHAADGGSRVQSEPNLPSQTNKAPGTLPRVLAKQAAPMTGSEKWRYYLKSSFRPKSFAYSIAVAGIKQARDSVPEWGDGIEGYGKRLASSFGQKIVSHSIRIGLDGLLHQDSRYFASGRSGIWSRIFYAWGQTFVVRKDSGGKRIAFSRFAGDFGAAYISRQWHPDSYHTTSEYLTSGITSVGVDAAKNVFNEFWPDIKRRIHR